MATQIRQILVPRLDKRFEGQIIDVAILEVFQKFGYDRPIQDQVQTVRKFMSGNGVFFL